MIIYELQSRPLQQGYKRNRHEKPHDLLKVPLPKDGVKYHLSYMFLCHYPLPLLLSQKEHPIKFCLFRN